MVGVALEKQLFFRIVVLSVEKRPKGSPSGVNFDSVFEIWATCYAPTM